MRQAKLCKFFPLTTWPIFGQQSAVHWGRYHWLQAHKAADKKSWQLRTITGLRKKLNELGLYWIALLHLNHCVNFQCKIFVKKWPSPFDCSSSTTRYYWSAVVFGSYVLSNVRPNVCVGQPAGGLGLLHKVRWSKICILLGSSYILVRGLVPVPSTGKKILMSAVFSSKNSL